MMVSRLDWGLSMLLLTLEGVEILGRLSKIAGGDGLAGCLMAFVLGDGDMDALPSSGTFHSGSPRAFRSPRNIDKAGLHNLLGVDAYSEPLYHRQVS